MTAGLKLALQGIVLKTKAIMRDMTKCRFAGRYLLVLLPYTMMNMPTISKRKIWFRSYLVIGVGW